MEKLGTLSEIEQEILRLADKLINENKLLNISNLYKKAQKKLSYSNEDISHAIYNLVFRKLIFPNKKITLSNILLNPNRKDILNYIEQNPGAHLREIREKLELNPKVANWHLKVLENFELIYRKEYLKYRTFFSSHFERGIEEPLLALKNDNAVSIFIVLYNHPELGFQEIKKRINLASNVIDYHIDRLITSGVVIRQKRNGNEYFRINENKLNAIQKYLNINLIEEQIVEKPEVSAISQTLPEIAKVPQELEVSKPIPEQKTSEFVAVRREYDYVGGGIRFKVAVENISKTVITDINVTLIPTAQYEIADRVKVIEVLRPGESRGLDYDLIPLTCGKSKVFGSVSLIDPFGDLHTSSVLPKEIWIKCPLVQPKRSSLSEIEEMKKQLQKGTAKILFKIDEHLAFNLVIDQISALDLSEVVVETGKYLAIYSGIAKVTNDNMVIESKVSENTAIISVWTKDMKQATGFLAYLKNLINIAFDAAYKLAGRTEKISQKIIDANDIIQRLFTLYDYCEGKWAIGDLLSLLKELKTKIERSYPGIVIIEKIKDQIEGLEANYREGATIPEKVSMDLELFILDWLTEMDRLACSNLEMYEQTFPEQETQIQQLSILIEEKKPAYAKLEKNYSRKIIHYLMVIDKNSGVTIFEYNFTASTMEPDLISGFLTAIRCFGTEIVDEETAITKLAYKNFEIILDEVEKITVALILKGQPRENVTKGLKQFVLEFESQYKEELINWHGNVNLFKDTVDLVKKIFE
ncbi:MAG TPA: winged helix-turn-helix transcriptional regulator [Candidatus Deferrimicrobium sp.]|nr:winged helix-turn-helix transcriptional regulator [Candidatus Deferrimicrobium sp.]